MWYFKSVDQLAQSKVQSTDIAAVKGVIIFECAAIGKSGAELDAHHRGPWGNIQRGGLLFRQQNGFNPAIGS